MGEPHIAVSDGETLEVAPDTIILRPPGCVWTSHLARVGFLSIDVSEVTFRTGFADQSHFGRWFKRIVGVSPAAYARSVRSTSWMGTTRRRSAERGALVEEELR